jgi:outer membrane protein assembly factor BamB
MRSFALLLILSVVAPAANWPHWRGPDSNGLFDEKSVPVEWAPDKNIVWKAPLTGLGTSTPVVWGDHIFLTSQIGDGPFEQSSRDFQNASTAKLTGGNGKVQFALQAFSRKDGHLLWQYQMDAEGDLPGVHKKHNLASPSCETDGELVYALFGTGQLVALNMDGKLRWSRHLGKEYAPFQILWGHGAAPALYKNTLILNCDHQGAAYLLALDKKTGKQIWKVDRGADRRSYATPFVVSTPKGDALIINSSERIDVFDPTTGEPLWHAGEPNRVPVPTPVFHDGVLYASRGYNSGPYMAIDVASARVKWLVNTGAPYVSSLLYYQGLIYMATETGIASCVDAANGKLLWRERLGGVFSASPVAGAGHVYLMNENGESWVLQAGRELKILHKNSLGERILASPAVSDGMIFLRSDDHLFAIR